ncbi:C40 family peptidase, partial [Aphanothece sacrum]
MTSVSTSLDPLLSSTDDEYYCHYALDLFDGSSCNNLATQVSPGRHLKVLDSPVKTEAIRVRLCEDGYIAWLSATNKEDLYLASKPYQPTILSRREIEPYLSQIIDFTKIAMTQPNYYLWGGTVGPNYDCSGLIQAAFANSGIWLPRDSYQQENFTKRITKEELLPGDLIFFGTEKVDHVAL